MTMRSCSVFLAIIFACICNVALYSMEAEGIHPRILSHIQKRSTIAENQKTCFENLISKKSSLLTDILNQVERCAEGNQKTDYISLMKKFALSIVEQAKEVLIKCDLKEKDSYLKCLKTFVIESKENIDEIRYKVESVEETLNEDKRRKEECLKYSASENKEKYTKSLSELRHCLSKTDALPQPQNKMDQLKDTYRRLQYCTKDDVSLFHDCLIESFANKDLMNHFAQNAATYYKELENFDNAENTCLRHFITKYVHDDFTLQFSLSRCVMSGLDKAAGKEEGDAKVLEKYGKLHKLLLACRVESNSSATEMCITSMLQKSQEVSDITWDSHKMSDSYLEGLRDQIYSTFNNEDTCMGYIFDSLQFKGVFMGSSTWKQCLDNHYLMNQTPATTEDVLTKLSVIEEALIMCTRSAVTAEFTECSNSYLSQNLSSLNYIVKSPLFNDQYLEGITKHDKTKGTCYEKIVQGHMANNFAPVVKCIGDRVFYRPNKN